MGRARRGLPSAAASRPETAEIALHEVQQSEWSLVYYLTPLAWIVGLAMLAIGAARQGAVPVWAGVLLALGGLMVGIETAVISNAYFIAAAAVLAAGVVAVGGRDRPHERRGVRPRRRPHNPCSLRENPVRRCPVPVLRSACWIRDVPRGRGRPGGPLHHVIHSTWPSSWACPAARRSRCSRSRALAWRRLPAASGALTLPPGFEQTTAISGLNEPTDVEIAPSGRVFVAEKSGCDPHLRQPLGHDRDDVRRPAHEVHNYSNRGLLSLAVDPDFPAEPYVYVYYTLDAPIGGTPPTYGHRRARRRTRARATRTTSTASSRCGSRGCASSGEDVTGPEQVLVNDWCQQFPFHAGGGLDFGADGYLYVSGGDGARWEIWDYGQLGEPAEPVRRPARHAPGSVLTPPTAEGGRLRAQDLRTSGDPLGLAGSLIRIDPDTGEGVLGNPMFASAEPNARRMLAHGFRNPVGSRSGPAPTTSGSADRGGGYFEELDRVPDPTDPVRNFGWPCYEGGMDANGDPYPRIRPRSDDQDLNICENLYAEVHAPRRRRTGPTTTSCRSCPGEDCALNPDTGEPAGNQISGLAFYPAAGSFPAAYRRRAVLRRPAAQLHLRDAAGPGRAAGPRAGGAVRPAGGRAVRDRGRAGRRPALRRQDAPDAVQRVAFPSGTTNQAPTARRAGRRDDREPPADGQLRRHRLERPRRAATCSSTSGTSTATASSTTRPTAQPTFTYMQRGTFTVTLRVTDTSGASDTDTLTITVDAAGRRATIDAPAAGTTWGAGESISFSGQRHGRRTAARSRRPRSTGRWCCATAPARTATSTRSATSRAPRRGSFTAPDHAEPGQIEVRLTATDPDGETDDEDGHARPAHRRRLAWRDPGRRGPDARTASAVTHARDAHGGGQTRPTRSARRSPRAIGNTTYRLLVVERRAAAIAQLHGVGATGRSRPPSCRSRRGPRRSRSRPRPTSRVEAAQPASNFGTENRLRTDDRRRQSFLRFQVAGITGRVTSAKLRLRSITDTADGPAVRGTTNDWSETGVTWANRPAPDRRGHQRRGRDRHQPVGRVGRDPAGLGATDH